MGEKQAKKAPTFFVVEASSGSVASASAARFMGAFGIFGLGSETAAMGFAIDAMRPERRGSAAAMIVSASVIFFWGMVDVED